MDNEYKSVMLVDRDGRYKGMSQEEVLARRLNTFIGWKCAAGVENMYISPDGNIFAATCKVSGFKGNVYEDKFALSQEWLTCNKEWCLCGADVMLRKAKTEEGILKSNEPYKPETDDELGELAWIAPYHYENFQKHRKTITWDLARRCNYSCSYCHPSISNTYEAHKSKQSLEHAVGLIYKSFIKTDKAKWVFSGGEPTLNPAFMDIVKFVSTKGDLIHVQTNGSRKPEYYAELIKYGSIGFSVHLDFARTDKILKAAQAILETQASNKEAELQWFGIRVMVQPGTFQQAKKLLDQFKQLKHWDQFGNGYMSSIYSSDGSDQLVQYTPEELEKIIAFS